MLLLNRVLSQQQWVALVFLTSGVGVVQLYSVGDGRKDSAGKDVDSLAPNPALGLFAVICACLISGYASCYFERVLKSPGALSAAYKPSVWVRNIQLSMFGMVIGLPIVLWEMRPSWNSGGGFEPSTAFWTFFDGFSGIVWLVIFLQVTGGLLGGEWTKPEEPESAGQADFRPSVLRRIVLLIHDPSSSTALVIQYADNLLKCFSTSLSILLSVAISVAVFDFQVRRVRPASITSEASWLYLPSRRII